MRQWQKLILLVTALLVVVLGAGPTAAHAADASYAGNTLLDYGIPADVIEVILNNSTASDGKTPAAHGETASTFTIADVELLATVSLADVTFKADGTVASSQADDVVASWIASAKP